MESGGRGIIENCFLLHLRLLVLNAKAELPQFGTEPRCCVLSGNIKASILLALSTVLIGSAMGNPDRDRDFTRTLCAS